VKTFVSTVVTTKRRNSRGRGRKRKEKEKPPIKSRRDESARNPSRESETMRDQRGRIKHKGTWIRRRIIRKRESKPTHPVS
jgi:hypothetical protein